jgi:GAF domain-containing protein
VVEEILVPDGASREERYKLAEQQVAAVLAGEMDVIANLANVSAIIKECLEFLWVGFYRRVDGELILGPFQGPLACSRIPITQGVCGAAVRERKTILVPKVKDFPGHIACSSKSQSEIVVPLIHDREVKYVLDIDSETESDFSDLDKTYLESIVAMLKDKYVI